MRITLENNEMVYIYFMERKNQFGMVDDTLPSVPCEMLFDIDGNWIGLDVHYLDKEYDEEFYEISTLKIIDEFTPKLVIKKLDDSMRILFRADIPIEKRFKQDCNIDISSGAIFGIELLLWLDNKIEASLIPTEHIMSVIEKT